MELISGLAHAFGYGRILLGLAALTAPSRVGEGFGIGADNTIASRYIGGRDLALGLGMVLGRRHGAARGWYEAAALVDGIDGVVTAVAGVRGAMPARRAATVTVLALGSAGVALALARLDEPGAGFSESREGEAPATAP